MGIRRFTLVLIACILAVAASVAAARAQCSGKSCQPAHEPGVALFVRPGDCKWGTTVQYEGPWNQQNCGYGSTYYWRITEDTVYDLSHDPDCVDTNSGVACQPCGVLPFQNYQCAKPITGRGIYGMSWWTPLGV